MEESPEEEDEDRGVVRVEEAGGEEVERFGAIRDERKVKELVDPRKPTAREVEEHERTHLPYRNWCAVCVMGKGKDDDHRKGVTGRGA